MKRNGFIIATMVLVLALFMGGCSTDSSSPPASMKFGDASKEFSINENFEFQVTFKTPTTAMEMIPISAGNWVKGKILNPTGKWNEAFTGTVNNLDSNNTALKMGVALINGNIDASVSYTGNPITSSTLTFSGVGANAGTAGLATEFMGGTYPKLP